MMIHLPVLTRANLSQEPFSPQTVGENLPAARRHRHRRRLSLLRRRLRTTHLHQGRQAHRHRGRSRKPHQRRHSLPQGGQRLSTRRQSASRHAGPLPRPLLRPLGDQAAGLGAGPDRPARQGRARRRFHRSATSKAGCSTRCAPSALSAAPRSTTRRTTSSRSCSAAAWAWCRSKTRRGYDTALRCPVWAPRSAAARPPPISRIWPTAIASCSWARTWPRPIRSASAGR